MQKKAFKIMVEEGGTYADALRKAGYSDAVVNNPGKVTGSQAFRDALESVGLTDRYLAKGYKEFTKAGELREFVFLHKVVEEIVDIDEDNPKYKKGKVNKEMITRRIPATDQKIKAVINRISGAELISIETHWDRRIAYYQRPDFAARKTGFELASKAKGHLAQDTNPFGEIKHTLSEEDRDIMKGLFGSKK